MLQSLKVKNYAIIDEISIDWDPSLNIITGETGAGKSILLGALSLILGKRADTSVLFREEGKCVVEAVFDVRGYGLKSFFLENELDYEDETIIRREISLQGRSRAFINDIPVQLPLLKELTEKLVSLHGQADSRELHDPQFQLDIIDHLAGITNQVGEYKRNYKNWNLDKKRLTFLRSEAEAAKREEDLLRFEYNELEKLSPETGEQEILEDELKTLQNAESILSSIQRVLNILDSEGSSVSSLLRQAINDLSDSGQFNQSIMELSDRLNSSKIEIDDIFNSLDQLSGTIEIDNERLEEVQGRIDELNRLQVKHRLNSADDLIQLMATIGSKLEQFESETEEAGQLAISIADQEKELKAEALVISSARNEASKALKNQVNQLLPEVGMSEGDFEPKLEKKASLDSNGMDELTFLFTANKGAPLQVLSKVASGGEISRLMLILKSIVAGKMALPTLIFDEIDTGISGETAMRVGKLMEQLGDKHQIICITHLPQMAGRGSSHFRIFKTEDSNKTTTKMHHLNAEERVEAIARMIGGDQLSENALSNARELLNS